MACAQHSWHECKLMSDTENCKEIISNTCWMSLIFAQCKEFSLQCVSTPGKIYSDTDIALSCATHRRHCNSLVWRAVVTLSESLFYSRVVSLVPSVGQGDVQTASVWRGDLRVLRDEWSLMTMLWTPGRVLIVLDRYVMTDQHDLLMPHLKPSPLSSESLTSLEILTPAPWTVGPHA